MAQSPAVFDAKYDTLVIPIVKFPPFSPGPSKTSSSSGKTIGSSHDTTAYDKPGSFGTGASDGHSKPVQTVHYGYIIMIFLQKLSPDFHTNIIDKYTRKRQSMVGTITPRSYTDCTILPHWFTCKMFLCATLPSSPFCASLSLS